MTSQFKCPVCQQSMTFAFTQNVMLRHRADYHFCNACGFLTTHRPTWLAEAYAEPISATDTGVLQRNSTNAKLTSILLYFLVGPDGKYLDIAGGYGTLTRMMRDVGFDFYWDDKYAENIFANGFSSSEAPADSFQAITAYEVLEHISAPLDFVKAAMTDWGADWLLFTTELFNGPPPRPDSWSYYSFAEGQHISFYRMSTLKSIASSLGLNFQSNGYVHLLSRKNLPPRAVRILCSRGVSAIFFRIVRQRLQSRTLSDQYLIRVRDGKRADTSMSSSPNSVA